MEPDKMCNVLDRVGDVLEKHTKMLGDFSDIHNKLTENQDEICKKLKNHEQRIADIENSLGEILKSVMDIVIAVGKESVENKED